MHKYHACSMLTSSCNDATLDICLINIMDNLTCSLSLNEIQIIKISPSPLCNGADKTRGVRIHMQAFIARHGQNTGRVEQMTNRYRWGKAEEYSSKRRGLRSANNIQRARQRDNQVTSRRSGTRQQGNTERLD